MSGRPCTTGGGLVGDLGWTSRARRIDPVSRVQEECGFVSTGAFLSVHRPADRAPHGFAVVCPTLHTGGLANYRREVNLGRVLAMRGWMVARPQYLGAGNSAGDADRLSLGTMTRDVRLAIECMAAEHSVEPTCLVGIRLGALVACALDEWASTPLALWEPVSSGSDYVRQAMRAELMRRIRTAPGARSTTDELLERLESTGSVELVGELLHRDLYDSLCDRSLSSSPGACNREVLLVSFGGTGNYSRLADELTARGSRVTTASTAISETWWFQDESIEPDLDDPATRATATWLGALIDPCSPTGSTAC